jgi:hypothetical protein
MLMYLLKRLRTIDKVSNFWTPSRTIPLHQNGSETVPMGPQYFTFFQRNDPGVCVSPYDRAYSS